VGAVLHKKNEISLPHKVICFFNRLMILAQNEIILLLPLFFSPPNHYLSLNLPSNKKLKL